MDNKKPFLNGLNELRAFAALSVILAHIELFKKRDGIGSLYNHSYFAYFIERIGKNGVYLFFVLSGFLITYLLLREKEKNHKISFKNFYLRRIFRIWPLYYLIILISFLLIPFLAFQFDIFQLTPFYFNRILDPANYNTQSIALYVLFLPNLALHTGKAVVGASQSWSVGVEEQFYVVWPFLILLFNRKKLFLVFLLIIGSFIFFNLFKVNYVSAIVKIVPIEFMAIGGIGGYLFHFKRDEVKDIFASRFLYFVILFLILILTFIPFGRLYIQNICLGCLFLVLILCTIQDSNPSAFRNKTFSFLGKISYGIYMYHPFVMFIVFPFANKLFNPQSDILAYNLFVYFFVILITIFISHLSYKYFESLFIRIKDTKYRA